MAERILVWSEVVRLRGDSGKKVVGFAMAADGTRLCQRTFPSVDWAKKALGVGTTENRDTYLEAYPLGYELVWLDDPSLSPDWWEATFFDDRVYRIRLIDHGSPKLWYFEFRDRKTAEVLGYVVCVVPLKVFFISPGHQSPRYGDVFPEPGYSSIMPAMTAAHSVFKELRHVQG